MTNIEETITDIVNTLSDLVNIKSGVYKAIVAETWDYLKSDLVDSGKIRVFCPDVYGADSKGKFILSPYCEPAFTSPHDFHVPEIGQTVWIMFEHGDARAPVWFGSFPKIDQIKVDKYSNVANESIFLEDAEKEGIPLSAINRTPVKDGETEQVGGRIEEAIDRVIGSRFGSYIKFDDRNKQVNIEVLGGTAVDRDRVGPTMDLSIGYDDDAPTDVAKNFSKLKVELPFGKDSLESPATADKTELLLTNNSLDLKIRSVDESTAKFSLSVDATDAGGGKIEIKVAGDKSVITIDKTGKMTITNKGDAKLDVTGKIDLVASDNITIDAGSKDVDVKGGNINITPTTLCSLDAATNLVNNLPSCLFTGAPHSTATKVKA